MKYALVAALALSWATAPYQCAADPDPERAMEDSAPKALWDLSERFRREGDSAARHQTLEYLVERYPSSRWAQRAQRVLERSPEPGST